MTSDSVIVTTINSVSTNTGDSPADTLAMPSTIKDEAPVDCSAPQIGIIDPNSTMTGHSTES